MRNEGLGTEVPSPTTENLIKKRMVTLIGFGNEYSMNVNFENYDCKFTGNYLLEIYSLNILSFMFNINLIQKEGDLKSF